MKKSITILALIMLTAILSAQAPEKMSYQAVVRNSTDKLIVNQLIGMRVSILQGTATGTLVYSETHKPTTNINGLASIEIGKGTVVSGTFSGINWSVGPYFIKTETDPTGGTTYSINATSELLSVPYALYAKEATKAGLKLPYEGTALTTEVGSSSFKVSNSGTNQVVAITGHATSSTNSTMGIYGRSDAYDGKGIYGIATHKFGITYGVLGVAESTFAYGVGGIANSTTGTTLGVYGRSSSSEGTGVYGYNSSESGTTYGVYGESKSMSGNGIYGKAPCNAIYGISTEGGYAAITGENNSGIGIYGKGDWGVYGSGNSYGVYGRNNSTLYAVRGRQENSDGFSGYFEGGKFYVQRNVGIGNSSPDYRLSVYAPGITSTGIAGFYNSTGDPKVIIRQNSNGSGSLNIYNTAGTATISFAGEEYASFINAGNLGIGTTTPNYKLDVRGTIGNNTTLYHSDRRWKTDFMPIKYNIHDLMKLKSVSYRWNVADFPDMGFDRNIQFGFIAQEFEEVIPELVITDKEGYKSIDYVKLTPVLVMAIQEQQKTIEGIKAENQALKARLEKIEKQDVDE